MSKPPDSIRIAYLVAGAAGMYCGSCMRDNRLAARLIAQGRDVLLLPLYTPIRTDEADVSTDHVYYGGINAYLQQKSAFFRHTPSFVDRVLDTRPLLAAAGRFSGMTSADDLGEMTVSVLRGEHGTQRKELHKLIEGLKQLRPTLINLPNLMFAGVASPLRQAIDVPIVCTLSGEDVFLDALAEPHRAKAFALIRQCAANIDAFVSPTKYYGAHSVKHFGVDAARVHHIPMGLHLDGFVPAERVLDLPFTIGYFARICPEKGLHRAIDAFLSLKQEGLDCRLRVAGYLGPRDQKYAREQQQRIRNAGAEDSFEFLGEVDRAGKIAFLQSLSVLTVPTEYHESKGFYVLEAMACGVPVVQPGVGSFVELVEATQGGILYDPTSEGALAAAIRTLMADEALRQQLGRSGRDAVHKSFTEALMADRTWELYERLHGSTHF